MKNKIKSISEVLANQVQSINFEKIDILKDVPRLLNILESGLLNLKELICAYQFPSKEEEIYFFKETKPRIFSSLIYLHKLYSIELNSPLTYSIGVKTYLDKEIEYINSFSLENMEFIKYYRSGQTFLDEYYFLRKVQKMEVAYQSFYFERDIKFSTHFDFIIANILANESLLAYLNYRLLNPNEPKCSYHSGKTLESSENWTDKKAALVELIYAIHAAESVNQGNIELKTLAGLFEKVFNVDLSDIYHIFIEIKNRKIDRTIYLNRLIKVLNRRMDETDSK